MPFFFRFKNTLLLWVCVVGACAQKASDGNKQKVSDKTVKEVVVGANRTAEYLPLLRDKNVAVVANQTSVLFRDASEGYTHLVDSLLDHGVKILKAFAPEHGFRGTADAGEAVADGIDKKTGIPVISLYGENKKPTPESLAGIDILLFDIQDVGVRFYTYIATLQFVMEAAADADIPVVVLDRPNPNGSFVDGPSMEDEFKGFLGLNNIPLVYGMTIGEYATMINEESWLKDGVKAELTVVPLLHYTHDTRYSLPIRPSPNLPNDQAVRLYPSLGLFEGTSINAGRGTESQFQRFGSPHLDPAHFKFSYTPKPNFGAKYPKHSGKLCHGADLSGIIPPDKVDLQWLIEAYKYHDQTQPFFLNPGMERHAGTLAVQSQIEAGLDADAIRAGWQPALDAFRKIRQRYLLYP